MTIKLILAGIGVLALTGAAWSQTLTREPPMGALKEGQTVYVDDGRCPKGQVMKVTGGNHVKAGGTQHTERRRSCVTR